jgi:hypothetical protein
MRRASVFLARSAEGKVPEKVAETAAPTVDVPSNGVVYTCRHVVADNVVLVKGADPKDGFKYFGLKWRPGWKAALKKEDAEVNALLIKKIKSGTLTLGDVADLAAVAAWATFSYVMGEMLGRGQLLGLKHDVGHH